MTLGEALAEVGANHDKVKHLHDKVKHLLRGLPAMPQKK